MRYSAVQEDSYGVGLGQETPPSDVDEKMMAATGNVEPGGGSAVEEGSMISNLPLLFANGYPSSLEKITLPELERFITFMVQCSLGHDTAEVINEPQWWPKEIKFSIPLVRPKKMNDSYMDNLKKLVFRCYTYHRSEYLLRFCSYLAQYPHDKLEYVNNWDSTTSLYLKSTGKLLVTFRNENMNYDKKVSSPRKKLLPVKKAKEYPNHTKCLRRRSQRQVPSPAMVEPPVDDIYLCDNCDAELIGVHRMKEHEKLCYYVEPRPPTPIDLDDEPELTQEQFMDYFHMSSKNPSTTGIGSSGSKTSGLDNVSQYRSSSRIRSSINLTRCPAIPFSSPAGLALAKKSKMMTEVIQQERLDRIERHLHAPVLTAAVKPKWLTKTSEFDKWSVSYKPNTRDKTNNPDEYVRLYNFSNYFSRGKPALDLRSTLLFVACNAKELQVDLKCLSNEELEELKNDPSKYKTPEQKIRLRLPSVELPREPDPGHQSNPIIIDLEEEEEPLPPRPPPPLTPRYPGSSKTIAVATITPIMAPTNRFPLRTSIESKPSNLKRPRSTSISPKKQIIVVDLCSSDEEGERSSKHIMSTSPSLDENRDPLQKSKAATTTITMPATTVNATALDMADFHSSLIPQGRFYGSKPCLSTTDSSTDWLVNLSVDSAERRRNGFHSPVAPTYKSTP